MAYSMFFDWQNEHYSIKSTILSNNKEVRMTTGSRRIFLLLLTIAILCPSLSGFAETENIVEEQMPYRQFFVAEAQEPTIPQYPFAYDQSSEGENEALPSFEEWWTAKNQQQQITLPYLENIRTFTKNSARYVLSGSDSMNLLYSPINTWNYLELISSISEGSSRAQVLNLLGIDPEADMADDALYRALYWDDGFSVCHPASSIWVNQRTALSEALLSKLAEKNHTSVFQGPMGEDVFDAAFQSWLNKQTNGLLKEVVNDLGFDDMTTISLCSSLYYRTSWSLPFNKDNTDSDVFYSAKGEKEAIFMRKEEGGGSVYLGAGFSSVIMDLQDGGYAAFVLPDIENSVEGVLQSEELFDFLFSGVEWPTVNKGRIRISMPKVDILAAVPLADLFARMGVADIFDPEKAEFSNDIISEDKLELTSVDQYSRLIMNEEGVEAASIIVSDSASFRIPNEKEIDFILNRPFVFAIFSETNIPLFIGVYNTP